MEKINLDFWMKTSLPNIKHKVETVDHEVLPPVNQIATNNLDANGSFGVNNKDVADLEQITVSGVDT